MSLRARLLLATAAIAVVALVAADIATYAALRSSLYNQVDKSLLLVVQAVEPSVANPGHGVGPGGHLPPGSNAGAAPQLCPVYTGPTGTTGAIDSEGLTPGTYVEVRTAAGKVTYHCSIKTLGSSVGRPELPTTIAVGTGSGHAQPPVTFLSASSGSSGTGFRVAAVALPTGPAGNERLQLVVAVPLTSTDHTLSTLLDLELVVTAGALVVALLLGAWLVRVGLRPLRRVEETAGAIAEGQLAERVPGEDKRTEVGRLARALNVMLERIQGAFAERDRTEADLRASEERMRRFVADASHELRTPVAAVAAYAELFERGAADRPDDLRRLLRGIRTESGRMGHLVEDLLFLARLDEGRALQLESVDLVSVAAEAVAAAGVVGPEWSVRLEATRPVEVRGDAMRLRQVLDNLLGNVRVHCPPGTTTVVAVTEAPTDESTVAGEFVELRVSDDGPGMSADHAARIFERFYRADQSRSRQQGGAGLGLAIVTAIVRAHGARVDVESSPGAGTVFTVRLPVTGVEEEPVERPADDPTTSQPVMGPATGAT